MKIGIMQPYFLPYIGYYQLIKAVDKFIIYDDVSFIKQGWINRNRILTNGKTSYITINLSGASSFKKINEIEINFNKRKILKTIHQNYYKSPFFESIYPLIEMIIEHEENNLAKFVINSLFKTCNFLDIQTELIISSQLGIGTEVSGYERVLKICKFLTATHYFNAIGGKELYSKEIFKENRIELKFLKTNEIFYNQFNDQFVPCLSIIDLMMFNSKERVQELLTEYELV